MPHIGGSPQQALSNIEDPVLVQPEDMIVVCSLYQVLQILPQKFVELFEYGLGLLHIIKRNSRKSVQEYGSMEK